MPRRLIGWCVMAAMALPLASAAGARTDDATIERFLTRADVPLDRYRGSRHMTAHNPRFNKEAWVDVDTQLNPAAGFTYAAGAVGTTGEGGGDALRVPIRPLRKHILLVDGALFLSPRDADLLRVEGRLSKSPSFWVSRVEVARRYARIAGVRVPIELESVAHVRLAGRSEMRIVYQYESINGQAVVPPSPGLRRTGD